MRIREKFSSFRDQYSREFKGAYWALLTVWMIGCVVTGFTDTGIQWDSDTHTPEYYADFSNSSLWNQYCDRVLQNLETNEMSFECVTTDLDDLRYDKTQPLRVLRCTWDTRKAYRRSLDSDQYSTFEELEEDVDSHCELKGEYVVTEQKTAEADTQ